MINIINQRQMESFPNPLCPISQTKINRSVYFNWWIEIHFYSHIEIFDVRLIRGGQSEVKALIKQILSLTVHIASEEPSILYVSSDSL